MRFICFFFFLFLFTNKICGGNVVRVGEKQVFKTIKEALKSVNDGDTIIVEKGIYKEGNIIIKKSICLIGDNMPILDGDNKYEVVSIKADYVTIKGFQVQHSSYAVLKDPGGIKVYESKYVQILDNYLYDNFFGIYLEYCQNCLVKSNKIVGFKKNEQEIGNGIHCWKSDSLQIIGNYINGKRDGIYFEFVKHSLIWRNLSKNNIRYGLHFMFSNYDTYITNSFSNNGAGVAVMFSTHVTMINNTFKENWGDASYGLLFKEISDCYMHGNTFSDNTIAIFMDGTNRVHVIKNTFMSNGWGMKIQANCMDNTIEYNNFINNTFDVSTNGSLLLNIFQENYWDKYEGYDMNKDGIGDVPFRPLSLYSMMVERTPSMMLLFRSFLVTLLDNSEKVIPSLTPENFIDLKPKMYSYPL